MSKSGDILGAVVTALAGVTGVPVFRSRIDAIARGVTPAIIVEPVKDIPSRNEMTGAPLDWEMTFQATIIVRDDVPDSGADSIKSSVYSEIMTDAALNAMLMDLYPLSINWEFHAADVPLGLVLMQFNCRYRTSMIALT